MSEQNKPPEFEPVELKTSDEEIDEKNIEQSSPIQDDGIQETTLGNKPTFEAPIVYVRASTPKSVQSNETSDREGLTPSEWDSDEFFSASETEPKKKTEKKKPGLSSRMEYLARPKKDFLDRVRFERLDGVLPEKSLPSWSVVPLPTKLPVARYPYEMTTTKLGENVYLPPPGVKMDLQDENNFYPPMKTYHSLHDPHLKQHFNKDKIRKHLAKNGYVSKSGRVVASLGDINDYRAYTRRILSERTQQIYRDEQEEQKREEERIQKLKIEAQEQRFQNTRAQTNLRSFIKNAVSSIREGSMDEQRERDRKTLNKEIQLKKKWKQSAMAKQERYERLYKQHMLQKHENEEKKRAIKLELARKDVEHLDRICRKREQEKLERKQRLEDFWFRKAEEQSAWVEKGWELEKKWDEDREGKIELRKTQALAPHFLRRGKSPKQTASEEEPDETLYRTAEKAVMIKDGKMSIDIIEPDKVKEKKEINIAEADEKPVLEENSTEQNSDQDTKEKKPEDVEDKDVMEIGKKVISPENKEKQ